MTFPFCQCCQGPLILSLLGPALHNRGYISEGRYGSAIAIAEKYELSAGSEIRQLFDDATEMLALRKQETAARARQDSIKSSDDFQIYKDAFLKATATLIDNGTCTLADYREMGGWIRSQSHKPKPVYFTYCGGMTVINRIYLDVNSGEIFR